MAAPRSVKFRLADEDGSSPNVDLNASGISFTASTGEVDDLNSSSNSRRRFKVAPVSSSHSSTQAADGGGGNSGSIDNDDNEHRRSNNDVADDVESGGGFVRRFSRRRRSSNDNSADTIQMTFGRNTLETLPHADHYRNLFSSSGGSRLHGLRQRPTLMELHEQEVQDEYDHMIPRDDTAKRSITEEVKPAPVALKFGWIQGVLVRCLLNIFGVMLFLRLSWVVAQAGLALATVIILLATVVTTLTALSMSTICTNGEVKGGGAYYMISRCLGPEFGGAIGVLFSLANAVAAAMYIVGFAETIRDILKEHNVMMVDEINDVRIIGVITAVAILLIALAGLSWEARTQLVLLAILTIAILNFMIGTVIPTSEDDQDKGFVGYNGGVFTQNLVPDFRNDHSFFSVFAIFFPAATGILAGANISGDLKDPQNAIPKGTLLAILLTTLTYLAMAWMCGWCVLRDAGHTLVTGAGAALTSAAVSTAADGADLYMTPSTSPLVSSSDLAIATTAAAVSGGGNVVTTLVAVLRGAVVNATTSSTLATKLHDYYGDVAALDVTALYDDNATIGGMKFPCKPGVSCKYGIHNDMQVMQLVSVFGPITIAGIISATLSSALASLVSAPRVFQAVCRDNIFPYIHVFGKGYGAAQEPRRAYALSFFIGIACICIGELNAIAPLISNFFLMSYALINYSCVDASLAKSPGWRPSFRFYSMWLSLLGAVLCVAVMFVINWWTALLTIGLVAILYFYVHYRKPDINWGSSTQAHVYRGALQHTQKLTNELEHVKNFRPQVLAMTGFPSDRPALVDFASSITRNISLMVCGQILQGDPLEKLQDTHLLSRMAYSWLSKRKVKSFYTPITANSLRLGMQSLMQSIGVGKLRPNTLMLGFKSDWQTAQPQSVVDYVNIIHDAFDLRYGVGILYLKEGLYNPTTLSPVNDPGGVGGLSRTANAILSMRPPFLVTGVQLNNSSNDIRDITSPASFTTLSTDIALSPQSEVVRQVHPSAVGVDGGKSGEQVDQSSGDAVKIDLSGPAAGSEPISAVEDQPFVNDVWDGRSNADDDYEDEDDDEEELDEELRKTQSMSDLDMIDVDRFHHRQKKGFIDVWWLFDDGGLSLLVPYIMTTKKLWRNCKLRVFTAGRKSSELQTDQLRMASLLNKFRIEFSSLTVIPDMSGKPHPDRIREFDTTISDWVLNTEEGETPESHPWKITEFDLKMLKDKTLRHIRLRELLQQYSSDATLIVLTLPIMRKGHHSTGLYMAWLDTLCRDMPPMLLLRGNQESVLTYYS